MNQGEKLSTAATALGSALKAETGGEPENLLLPLLIWLLFRQ